MTRLTIGGLAAGTFTLGLLAGLVLPGTLAASRHQLMADHMSAMGPMLMMDMGSMHVRSIPMRGMDGMPMSPGPTTPAEHETHHASPEFGQ